MIELDINKTAVTLTRRRRLTCVLSARSRSGQTQTAIVMESPLIIGKDSYIAVPYQPRANAIEHISGATTC